MAKFTNNIKSFRQEEKIDEFLAVEKIPMRLACIDKYGFPLVCSLWFYYHNDCLWAATHEKSYLIKCIKHNARIAFEISTNDYPYRGVRGKGTVELTQDDADIILRKLIDRYLGKSNQKLSNWLMSRVENEYILKITPITINSWDFSNRMEK